MNKEKYREELLDQLYGNEKALDNAIERYKKANSLLFKIVEMDYVKRYASHIDEVLRELKNNEEG